jgi:hypothetical protein
MMIYCKAFLQKRDGREMPLLTRLMTPEAKRHFRVLGIGASYILVFVPLVFFVLLSFLGNSPERTITAFLLFPAMIGYAWLDWLTLVDVLPYLFVSIVLMAYGLLVLKKHACFLFWIGFILFCFCGSSCFVYVATTNGWNPHF